MAEREAPVINPDQDVRISAANANKSDKDRLRELHFIGEEPPKVAPVGGDPNRSIRDAIVEYMEQNPGIQPNLSRGIEQELDTIRDMETLRANMINMKIHVGGDQIRNAFLFKKDVVSLDTGTPNILDTVMETAVPRKIETVVKKGAKKKKVLKQPTLGPRELIQQMPNEGKLKTNDKLEHKVYQYGNYPIQGKTAKPKNGQWRLKMPPNADWTGGRQGTEKELAAWHEAMEDRKLR